MPALINIEVYESLTKYTVDEIEVTLNNFQNNSDVKIIESKNEFPNYNFKAIPNLIFSNYRRDLNLVEKWHVLEFCTKYENVLYQVNRQIVFNEGIKDGLIKILKIINEYFSSPTILVTNEVCNGFFFENKFGAKSEDFAEFEMGLIKKDNLDLVDSEKYRLLEENDNYNIYIQENEYITWK
jgi:hypothetical protein